MKKIKKSTLLPLLLLIYLAFMAYQGLPYFYAGRYAYYFGIIIATLIIIVLLHFTLKHWEKQKGNSNGNDKTNSNTTE
mgnify:CR=1 FL=1